MHILRKVKKLVRKAGLLLLKKEAKIAVLPQNYTDEEKDGFGV